jgi:hypothetical protein
MVDAELVEKKLAFIETCVDDIRRLANLELIESDIREERFVSHTLQLAIQAALDVASHLVSDMRSGSCSRYYTKGWVSPMFLSIRWPGWQASGTSWCMVIRRLIVRFCVTLRNTISMTSIPS